MQNEEISSWFENIYCYCYFSTKNIFPDNIFVQILTKFYKEMPYLTIYFWKKLFLSIKTNSKSFAVMFNGEIFYHQHIS